MSETRRNTSVSRLGGGDSAVATPTAGLEALLEQLPVGVFTTDRELRVHSLNRRARELTGLDPGAVVGRRCDAALQCSFCGPIVRRRDPPPEPAAGPDAPQRPDERIRSALERTAGCVTRAARLLGVHRTTLWRRMRELDMQREEFLP